MNCCEMKDIDIRTVDLNTLVDANEVIVNMDLPKIERMKDVAKQMGNNLYCFKAGGTVVKIGHTDTQITIDERIESFLRMQ